MNYGATINSSQMFGVNGTAAINTALNSNGVYGHWAGGNVDSYLGVRFNIGSAVHYGYIHLNVVDQNQFIVLDYGYEDVEGQGIPAGATPLLSVELSQFNARTEENDVHLFWQTETEIENAGFSLQRSTENIEWEDITWKEGQGTTIQQQQYSYIDRAVEFGQTYYYRLKQVALDEEVFYSHIVSASLFQDPFPMGIPTPNPIPRGTDAFIEIEGPNNGQTITATFIDSEGRQMHQQFFELQNYSTRVKLNTSLLPIGIYFVKIASKEHAKYRKIVVQ